MAGSKSVQDAIARAIAEGRKNIARGYSVAKAAQQVVTASGGQLKVAEATSMLRKK